MSIGFLALFFALLFTVACWLSRPQEKAHTRVDCRPVNKVYTVDIPTEI